MGNEGILTRFLLLGHGTFPDEYALAFKLLAPPMVEEGFEPPKSRCVKAVH
jgi:hypothetical protein